MRFRLLHIQETPSALTWLNDALTHAGAVPDKSGPMHLSLYAGEARQAVVSTWDGGLERVLFHALKGARAPCRVVRVELQEGRVDVAEIVDSDDRVEDLEEEAGEIVHDWSDGGRIYDDEEVAVELAWALLDLEEGRMRFKGGMRFAVVDKSAWQVALEPPPPAQPPSVATPGPWRRFSHADGRRWSVRVVHRGYEIEIVDEGVATHRARPSDAPEDEVAALIRDQAMDGFVES